MNGRRILAALFLLPAIAAGYMTWLMWRAGDNGQWLFGVFTVFFLLLAVAPLVPEFREKPPNPEPPPNTRFVPHWFMLLAILAIIATAVLAVVNAFLSH